MMKELDTGNTKELIDDGIEGISITTLQEGCVSHMSCVLLPS